MKKRNNIDKLEYLRSKIEDKYKVDMASDKKGLTSDARKEFYRKARLLGFTYNEISKVVGKNVRGIKELYKRTYIGKI